MLFTIGVLAIAVSLEPFRIGMTVLMLNRPRPLLQLLAFLAGGFTMGQWLSMPMIVIGIAMMVFAYRRSRKEQPTLMDRMKG